MRQLLEPLPATGSSESDPAGQAELSPLVDFVATHPRLFVLTGAGCSTASGIPDYRDADGRWRGAAPILHARYLRDAAARRRYWARSLVGWPRVARTRPNAAHRALAELERVGHVRQLVTQNVDGLHQQAGSRRVIDLHGRLDLVDCQGCGWREPRARYQDRLRAANPGFEIEAGAVRPDGDVRIPNEATAGFRVPDCPRCGGLVKPHVVFFGGSVPRPRVDRAMSMLDSSDAVLVVGSSLTVYSGYRFVRRAVANGQPVAAINLGRTRADREFRLKWQARCDQALPRLVDALRRPVPT